MGFKKQFHEEYILHSLDAAYITQNFHASLIPLSLLEMPSLRLCTFNPTLQGLAPLPQPWVMPSFSELLDHSLYIHLLMIFYFFPSKCWWSFQLIQSQLLLEKLKLLFFQWQKQHQILFMKVSISIYKFVFGTPKQNYRKRSPFTFTIWNNAMQNKDCLDSF